MDLIFKKLLVQHWYLWFHYKKMYRNSRQCQVNAWKKSITFFNLQVYSSPQVNSVGCRKHFQHSIVKAIVIRYSKCLLFLFLTLEDSKRRSNKVHLTTPRKTGHMYQLIMIRRTILSSEQTNIIYFSSSHDAQRDSQMVMVLARLVIFTIFYGAVTLTWKS